MHSRLTYLGARECIVSVQQHAYSIPHPPLTSLLYCASSDKFVELFVKATNAPKVGNPLDEDTFQGAQANKRQFDTILSFIEDGKKAGAKVETGGERIGNKGYFVQPTVFSNVKLDMRIAREEIFGRSTYVVPSVVNLHAE